jgi:hypothetical protein
MKHLKILCLLALVCSAAGAFAQAAAPNAQAKKPATLPTIASAIDQQVSIVEREFVGAPPRPCQTRSSISLPSPSTSPAVNTRP